MDWIARRIVETWVSEDKSIRSIQDVLVNVLPLHRTIPGGEHSNNMFAPNVIYELITLLLILKLYLIKFAIAVWS